MSRFVKNDGRRGKEYEKIAQALRETNIIKIMQDYSRHDTNVCIDMIKASAYNNSDYVNNALKEFLDNALAQPDKEVEE